MSLAIDNDNVYMYCVINYSILIHYSQIINLLFLRISTTAWYSKSRAQASQIRAGWLTIYYST